MPLLVAQRSAVHGVALDHQSNQSFYQQYQPFEADIRTSSERVQFTKIDQPSAQSQSPSNGVDCQPPQRVSEFTMSKFKASSRHPLYRQYYGPDESPPYEKQEEPGNCQQLSIRQLDKTELSKQGIFTRLLRDELALIVIL